MKRSKAIRIAWIIIVVVGVLSMVIFTVAPALSF